jgi:hypothetical protein
MSCAHMKYTDKETNKEVEVRGETHARTAELAKEKQGVMIDSHTGEILLDYRESKVADGVLSV